MKDYEKNCLLPFRSLSAEGSASNKGILTFKIRKVIAYS